MKLLLLSQDAQLQASLATLLDLVKGWELQTCGDLDAAWAEILRAAPTMILLDLDCIGDDAQHYYDRYDALATRPLNPLLATISSQPLGSAHGIRAVRMRSAEYLVKPVNLDIAYFLLNIAQGPALKDTA